MPPSLIRAKRTTKTSQSLAGSERWKLEDAKAKFSEVVGLAGTDGPRLVAIRGKAAVMIIAPEAYKQLLPKPKEHQPLIRFLQGLGPNTIEIKREKIRKGKSLGERLITRYKTSSLRGRGSKLDY
jgi:hypothetical protein